LLLKKSLGERVMLKKRGNLHRLSAKEEEPTRKGNMQVIFATPFRETLFHSHALYGFC
jgi:hypothetical protein